MTDDHGRSRAPARRTRADARQTLSDDYGVIERRGPKETWGVDGDKNRRILNLTDDSEKPLGEWNKMVIECVGDEVKVWVNGDLVNHGTKCTVSKD